MEVTPTAVPARWQRLVGGAVAEVALALGVVVAVWWPFLRSQKVDNRYGDWSFRADYLGYELNAWRHDRQIPLWVTAPRFEQFRVKGVHDFFANPETDVLSIVPPLAAATDYLIAVKIELLACLALGVLGCRRLLQALTGRAGLLPSLALALLALCNGAMTAHVIVGHTQFVSTAAFPFVLALLAEAFDPVRPARDRQRAAALAGGLLALAYYAGNTHPLFYFLLAFVGLWPLLCCLQAPRAWRPILSSATVAGCCFLGLAAVKLLPGIVDLRHYRTGYLMTFGSPRQLLDSLVKPWTEPWGDFSHEYNAYVGWGGLLVVAAGLLGLRDRRLRPLLVAALLLGALLFLKSGSRLLELPFLRTQGVLTRLRLVALPPLAAAGAVQIASLDGWLSRHPGGLWTRGLLAALALLFAFDLSRANVARHVEAACRDELPRSQGPFDEAPAFQPVGPGVVKPDAVRANSFSYAYALPGPGLLVARDLPASPRPHLALDGDGELTEQGGKLAVRVRKPAGSFRLRYFDPLAIWGLVASIATVLALGWLLRRPAPAKEAGLEKATDVALDRVSAAG